MILKIMMIQEIGEDRVEIKAGVMVMETMTIMVIQVDLIQEEDLVA